MTRREFALPGTRPRYTADRVCNIRHLKLEIDLDIAAKRIAGTCTLTLSPIVSGPTWLRLDAVELEIAGATREGRALEFRHDGKVLQVNLGTVTAGDAFDLAIRYAGSPRRGIYFVGPDDGYPDKPSQVWTQGQDEDSRFWFPCFDAPSEKATSEVIATVPARFFALSNGSLLADRTSGDKRTLHWRLDTPHSCYLITLAAGELTEIADTWEGPNGPVDVTYYVAPGREDDARRALERTPKMLELFSRLFGVPYPFDKYAQVFVADFIFGGMENTTATTLTDVVLYDQRAALDYDADALVAHELAHQWFGDLLTCRSWGEGWLNEGFATYSEYLWRESYEGRDAADIELDGWAEDYFGEDSSRYRRIVATNVYDEPIEIFDHHLYEKGGRVLHMLRQVLGDSTFFAGLAHYLTKHRTGSVETRDLALALEEATGRRLEWFFDQWVSRGAGHPELEVGYEWDAERKLAVVSVKQTHKVDDKTPLFRLPTSIEIASGGDTRSFALEITDEQHRFYLPCEAEPTAAVFDPGKVLLAIVKTDKPEPLWIEELTSAELAIDRVSAARALSKRPSARATGALIDSLRGDRSWIVRSAAASALGHVRGDLARDALVDAARATSHPKARRAVVRALGAFRHDKAVSETIARIAQQGDESYFVEAEACLSLGKLRAEGAAAVLTRASERDSFLDTIRTHCYEGLAETRDDSVVPFLMTATTYGRASYGRRAALSALAKLGRGRRDRLERDIRERAEELLRDPDFRVQSAALEALAVLGDPASLGALGEVVERELDGRLRRRSKEIIRDIGEGRAPSAEVSSLRDEVDRLRGEMSVLRERVDRVHASDHPHTPGVYRVVTKSTTAKPLRAKPPKARSLKELRALKDLKAKATQAKATQAKATKPKATKPKATKPKATKPKATKPKATKPAKRKR